MSGLYDVTLTASTSSTQNIPASGSFVKVKTAPAGAVKIRLDGGESYLLSVGQGLRLPDGKTFRDVQVTNGVAIAQTVVVFVGDSRFEDTSISGSISVIDGPKTLSANGQAFTLYGHAQSSAGNFGSVSLVNLANSTKRIVIDRVTFLSLVAQTISCGPFTSTAAGGTGAAVVITSILAPPTGGIWATPAAQGYQATTTPTNPVDSMGDSGNRPVFSRVFAANESFVWTPPRPVVLPAGVNALRSFITAGSNNAGVFTYDVWIDFYEETP